MSLLPYPKGFHDHLRLAAPANRSLLFDRAMDRYVEDKEDKRWKIADRGKEGFLQSFVQEFRNHRVPGDFQDFVSRRSAALKQLGASGVDLFTRSRLLIGLGLPHPIETGFLLDRLTGCPYLPGSSVKGLVRATARLVMEGELEGNRTFWTRDTIVKTFGPELAAGVTPQAGSVSFYDAFPTVWPELEVDVLTPHYGKHYRGEEAPADWEQPVPVPFLAIQAGTPFRFYFSSRNPASWTTDFAELRSLLELGLEWLGIGAKKASGYGLFGKEKPEVARRAQRPIVGTPPPPPPTPPPPQQTSKITETRWTDVEIGWHQSSPAVIRGKQIVSCPKELLEKDLLDALKNKKTKVKADVLVVKIPGGGYRVDKIESWKIVP